MKVRFLLPIIILSLMSLDLSAIRALDGIRMLRQPDGTEFCAVLKGDEFSHIMMTVEGNAIVQDEKGYWCYAMFDDSGCRSCSGVRVGTKGVPSDILSASRNIPYGKLFMHAASVRALAPIEEENLMQRLNRMNFGSPATKAGGSATKHGIVILAAFNGGSDSYKGAFRFTQQNFLDMMSKANYSYGGATGSVTQYFNDQFMGRYSFEFDVSPIVTVSQPREYYGANDKERQDLRPAELIREACILASQNGVDFSKYDDDKDGEVDNVFVFYAGGDEAEYVGDDYIWAHSWYLKDGAGISLTLNGKRINRYACASELSGNTEDVKDSNHFRMSGIGTFCHEFSHTLGLPDFYDTDYEESGGTASGLYHTLSLMDTGNYNNGGNTPPNYNALERSLLGISSPLEIPAGKVTLEAVHKSGKSFLVESDTQGEYFLLECRSNDGWDKYIGGYGLVAYHVDRSNNSAGRSEKYGRPFTAMQRWLYNEINANPAHECACPVPTVGSPRSVKQIFFPYSGNNSINPDAGTGLKFWSGEVSPVKVTGISYSDGTVIMNVLNGDVVPPEAIIDKTDNYQDASIVQFSSSYPFDGEATVRLYESNRIIRSFAVSPYETGKYAAVIEGLSPSKSYKVEISFTIDELEGETASANFMTVQMSTEKHAMPYIFLKRVERYGDGNFVRGATLPLRVFDAKNVDGILWTLDGRTITLSSDGYYHLEKGGVLKAEVIYKDGTRDFLVKEINMK